MERERDIGRLTFPPSTFSNDLTTSKILAVISSLLNPPAEAYDRASRNTGEAVAFKMGCRRDVEASNGVEIVVARVDNDREAVLIAAENMIGDGWMLR